MWDLSGPKSHSPHSHRPYAKVVAWQRLRTNGVMYVGTCSTIRKYEAMDRDADFTAFAGACEGQMLRLAFLLCGDADLAKDLVQETFTKMYVAWPRIRDKERLRAYARVTMARELHTWRRRRRVGSEIPVDVVPDHAGCDEATSLEDSGALIAALLSLTPRERLAIVLRYYEQLS